MVWVRGGIGGVGRWRSYGAQGLRRPIYGLGAGFESRDFFSAGIVTMILRLRKTPLRKTDKKFCAATMRGPIRRTRGRLRIQGLFLGRYCYDDPSTPEDSAQEDG